MKYIKRSDIYGKDIWKEKYELAMNYVEEYMDIRRGLKEEALDEGDRRKASRFSARMYMCEDILSDMKRIYEK